MTQKAHRQPQASAAAAASIDAANPPMAELVHHRPITRPRSPREKNSPTFLARGAQPHDWHSPCTANSAAIITTDEAQPLATATTIETSMPPSTKRRVPNRSPATPAANCPTA